MIEAQYYSTTIIASKKIKIKIRTTVIAFIEFNV